MSIFIEKLDNSQPFYTVKSRDAKDRTCYFILQAKPSQIRALKLAAQDAETVDLTRFGKIITSGFDECLPTASI